MTPNGLASPGLEPGGGGVEIFCVISVSSGGCYGCRGTKLSIEVIRWRAGFSTKVEWMESLWKTNQIHTNWPLLTFVWNFTSIYKQALQMGFYQVPNGCLHLVWNLLLCCYHIYSTNSAIIRYNNRLICGNAATCFGHFQGGIQQNNTMAILIVVPSIFVYSSAR
jgi:hypothetical protein